jgi:hypothetical protein
MTIKAGPAPRASTWRRSGDAQRILKDFNHNKIRQSRTVQQKQPGKNSQSRLVHQDQSTKINSSKAAQPIRRITDRPSTPMHPANGGYVESAPRFSQAEIVAC